MLSHVFAVVGVGPYGYYLASQILISLQYLSAGVGRTHTVSVTAGIGFDTRAGAEMVW